MENVITHIVEIEQECAARIEEAARASRERIAAHQQHLADKKAAECARIESAANAQFEQVVREAQEKSESFNAQFRKAQERLYQDPALAAKIKETIVSLLLG